MSFLPDKILAPLNAMLPHLRDRKVLTFTFLLSLAAHLTLWLAMPNFIYSWPEPSESSFDAVLVPIAEPPSTAASVTTAALPSVTRRASATSARKPAKKANVPESIASLIPPPIEVAPERPRRLYTEDLVPATNHDSPVDNAVNAAEKSVDASASPSEIAPTPGAPTVNIEPLVPPSDSPPPELPSRISIAYKMSSNISDGVADYTWTRDGDRFEIDSSMQATGFIVGNLIGVLHQVSRGVVTPAGLQPESFQIRRGDAAADTAEFLRGSNELKLTRAGSARVVPLPPLIQDMQSFLFQLAYDAPKLRQPDDQLEVQVTNGRKVYRHRFKQVGMETLQLRSGTVQAMHLRSEASNPEDTYEVWLAVAQYHLPVKIKFFAGRFPVELIAASIRTTP